MIEINLIPDVKRELLRARMTRNVVISVSTLIGVAAVSIVVILGLIFGGQLAAEAFQDRAIKDKSSALLAVEDLDKTLTIQHQLGTLKQAVADKSIQSRLLDVLGAINPPAPNQVKIAILKLDPANKTISIEGSAENGYLALEVFKKTISTSQVQFRQDKQDKQQPLASDIQAGEANFGENAEGKRVLRFSFTFTYPDELFMNAKDPVTVVTPAGRTDVTDSKLGVPASLFGASQPAQAEQKEGNSGR